MFVIIFICLMANSIVWTTLNRDHINWTASNAQDNTPTNYTFSLSSFKFGVEMVGINLNDPNISYFDVVAVKESMRNGVTTRESISVGPC